MLHPDSGVTRLAALCLLMAAVAGQTPAEGPPPLRSACERDYPPFCLLDGDGRPTGFSVELLRAALRTMGRDVTFATGTWAEVRGFLERGEVEVLPLVGRTPEREALFDFTVPYLTMHGAIVVREDTEDIRSLEDLRARRVAVMRGDNAEEFLRRKDRGLLLTALPSFPDALEAVARGTHDAVVLQRLVALRLLQEAGIEGLRVLPEPVTDFHQDFCFAVRKGHDRTLALLNEGLALVSADGTRRSLHARWFAHLELPQDRRLVFGGDAHFPPFEFLNDRGRPDGFSSDLTRAVARETGLDIEIRLGNWANAIESARRGEIDALQGVYYTPGRGAWLRYSPEYLTAQYVAVTRRGAPPPKTLADLAGHRLAVQDRDLIHDHLLEQGVAAPIAALNSMEDVLRAVREGKHEIGLVSRMAALYLIGQRGWEELVVGKAVFLSGDYCFGVTSDNRALLAQLSEGLQALEASGEYRKIYNKWLAVYDGNRVPVRSVLRYGALILTPLLLVLAATMAGAVLLRRQVAKRTAELAASENRYRCIFRNEHTVMLLADAGSGAILDANPAAAAFYGWSEEELRGMRVEQLDVRGPDRIQTDFQQIIEKRCTRFLCSNRLRDGSVREMEVYAAPIPLGRGPAILAILHDITERRQAEDRVRRLHRILQAIREIDQWIVRAEDPHQLISRACRILVENRKYREALILRVDVQKGHAIDATHKGHGRALRGVKALVKAGTLPACCGLAPGQAFQFVHAPGSCTGCAALADGCGDAVAVLRIAHGEQTFGYLLVRSEQGALLDDEEQDLLRQVSSDVGHALHALGTLAAHERMQQQLFQTQKIESVGRLAGGVAHDFNNMLMGIMGYAELCRDEIPTEHPAQELLQQILACSRRSANLTRQLLAFARKQTVEPKVLNLNTTITTMLTLLRRLLGEDIQIAWIPGVALHCVRIDPGQVDQILANLCVNAREAIEGVGKVTLETANVEIGDEYGRTHPDALPGAYVMLAVTDSGRGMDKATLEQLFEPFFTTKTVGEGVGLGLATVYGIVRQNRGFINVYSEPGRGSTFKIYLPKVEGEPDEAPMTSGTGLLPPPPAGQGQTILLVEDEAPVLESARRFLEGAGYRVLAANGPQKALRIAESVGEDIALLLTDVVMPEMNGRDLSRKLLASHPGIRCLFMSGYTANAIAHQGILDPGVAFLAKPFGRKELLRKVGEMLNHETNPGADP